MANINDGEFLIQIQPHVNGYQLSLASKTGMGDAAFLLTFGRDERFRRILETEYDAVDADVVIEVLEDQFSGTEYRIVKIKKGVKHFRGRGAYLYVETGKRIPRLTDERDYRDNQWSKEDSYRLNLWPTDVIWIEVEGGDSGDRIADYRPHSYLEEIRQEEKDEHVRDCGPTSVSGVHAPVESGSLDDAPVVHTRSDCPHLEQIQETRCNPSDEQLS